MKIFVTFFLPTNTAHNKCRYSQLFWPTFFPHFPAFGLNTERFSPYLVRMRENARKMRTRITPNTDTFYAVKVFTEQVEKGSISH